MPPKTIRRALADMLEDLSKQDFDKFVRELLDRRSEPRVRRNRVEGKNFLDIADVLVNTFTEDGALQVAVELLKQIECQRAADDLVKETGGQASNPEPPTAATDVNTMAGSGCTGRDFVDKHRVELIKRVDTIAAILDDLLDRKILSQESYDKIRALSTTQEKMRELYSGCLKAAGVCKDAFYEILEKHEPYLIADLKGE